MKFLKSVVLITVIAAFYSSCTDDFPHSIVENEIHNEGISNQNFKSLAQSAKDENLFEYARLLSLAVTKNKDLHQTLEEKALRLLRNNYYEQEFYVGMEGDVSESKHRNKSLHDLLVEVGDDSTPGFLKKLEISNPDLSVLLIDEEVTSKQFNNKVFVDNHYNDMNPSETIYYFENGILKKQSLEKGSSEKCFIVRNSEVYVEEDNTDRIVNELFTNKSGISIKVDAGAFDVVKEKAGRSGKNNDCHLTNPSIDCERDCVNLTENLNRFRTENDYDGFGRGKGEWFFVFIFANDVNYSIQDGGLVIEGGALDFLRTGLVTGVRGNNQWRTVDFSVFIWDRMDDGDKIKVACYESDGGSTRQVSLTLTVSVTGTVGGSTSDDGTVSPGVPVEGEATLPINFTINNGDDEIGEYIVDYCQTIGTNGFIYHPAAVVDIRHNER